MGIELAEWWIEELKKRGLLGKKLDIVPVRIGMPGEPMEGDVLGPPKKKTRHPIDRVTLYGEETSILIGFFSRKAGSKPITYRRVFINNIISVLSAIIFIDEKIETEKGDFFDYIRRHIPIEEKLKKLPREGRLLTAPKREELEIWGHDVEKWKGRVMKRPKKEPPKILQPEYPLQVIEEEPPPELTPHEEPPKLPPHEEGPPEEGVPCPNCYHIHGPPAYRELVSQVPGEYPDWINEYIIQGVDAVFYCNDCRNYFVRKGKKIIPVVNERCDICGGQRITRNYPPPSGGAHTSRIYEFICPVHGPGLHATRLSAEDYGEWQEQRKIVLNKNLDELDKALRDKLAKKHFKPGGYWDHVKKKFEGALKLGHKTDFRNQLEDVRRLISKGKKNVDGRAKANISAEEVSKDKENKELINKDEDGMTFQKFIESKGLSDKDTRRFSKEEQEEYEKGQEEIKKKTEEEKLKEEEKIEKEKLEKKRAKLPRRIYDPLNRFAKKVGHNVRTVFFSLLLLVVGVAISATLGNIWFMVGFLFWSFYTILPDPEETKIVENVFEDVDPESPEAAKLRFKAGSLLATKENRTNTGLAFMKAVMKVGIIVCFIGGLYTTPFPTSNLILLFLAFGFYFSMPVEFEPRKPYDFILSFFRVLLGVFIAVFIFGAFGAGIFQSRELGWLTLAFFVVFPVATEKESITRALGRLGSGTGEGHEMLDKIIFLFIMLAFLAGGFGLMGGGFSFVGGFFSGTGGIIFSAVWVLGLISGLTTPAETRPWMGVIILIVGFTVFGLGAGQQAMGVAFFGEWWPTVHNTVTEFMEPIGDMFSQFQQTFGQTWLLFTSPTEFAKQITQGTYAKNELGVTGAYGLEINRFDVQSIYIDEPFMIQIDLENKGIFHAKNVSVDILTNIRDFRIATDTDSLENDISKMKEAYTDEYEKIWYKFTIDQNDIASLRDVERQDAVPIFLMGKMKCEDFKASAWNDFGVLGGRRHTVREMFIPFIVNVTYEYEANSNLQIDFISTEEWRRLSTENKLARGQKASVVSTSPASLNLGGMDQPIKEDSPFYVGFNLSTTWPKNSQVTGGKVSLYLPKDFGPLKSFASCTKIFTITPDPEGNFNYTFNLEGRSKSAFCSYDRLPENTIKVPKKTYTVSADAVYMFSRWKEKDTQFNFLDVCWPEEVRTAPGNEGYCSDKIESFQMSCDLGEGGCRKDSECDNTKIYPVDDLEGGESFPLKCDTTARGGVGVCCPFRIDYEPVPPPGSGSMPVRKGATKEQCEAAHYQWLDSPHNLNLIKKAMWIAAKPRPLILSYLSDRAPNLGSG